ncbi:MAG: lipocalin-like domain-containing protein [Thermoanaerobaculia bacterium]
MRALGRILLATALSAPIAFPRDHGAHESAALEWWYWTGHLSGERGRAYGFQLTFFRLRDLHLAHFAWSDLEARTFVFEEKAHLSLPGIAGAAEGNLDVFNEDWSARGEAGGVRLKARTKAGELALTLTPSKPPVLHGEDGLSRKGPGENEYSRYVSITRLVVSGSLTRGGKREALSGAAWFDHEWGPGALPEGAAGWDWFALQMDDGSELMLYRMRLKNGTASPFSGGTYVPASGPPRPIAWREVRLSPVSTWTSPRSKAVYPAVWSLSVAPIGLEATITPLLADQELSTSRSTGVTYWEGACRIAGSKNGRPAGGRAYVEMTGYAGRDVPGFAGP